MSWWRRNRKTLREELTEARDNIQRQLDIILAGPADSRDRWQPGTVEELQSTLAQLNERIADLGHSDC